MNENYKFLKDWSLEVLATWKIVDFYYFFGASTIIETILHYCSINSNIKEIIAYDNDDTSMLTEISFF